jgi:hypothetical protein
MSAQGPEIPPSQLPTPDPGILTSANTGDGTATPLTVQITQADLIAQAQFDDPTLTLAGCLGGLPVAEKNQDYFSVVREAGDTSPEIIGKTQFFISYLCDSNLNISKPSEDSVSLINLTQNFETGKNARVRVDQGTALNPQLAGLHKIHAVGTPEPILATQVGKGPFSYVTTMSFIQDGQLGSTPGILVADYNMYYDMHGGYRTTALTFDSHSGTRAGAKINFVPFQTVQDYQTSSALHFSSSNSYYVNDGNYNDTIVMNSGSLEGRSRIKIKGHIAISLASSSILDVYNSRQVYLASEGFGSYNPDASPPVPIKGELIRKRAGVNSVIYSDTKTVSTYNAFLAQNLSNTANLNNDSSWADVSNACYLQIDTPYFSAQEDDEYFFKVILPTEVSSSTALNNNYLSGYLTTKPQYSYRTYKYFSGYMQVSNETPHGVTFFNGITGITASYSDQDGNPTIYNETSSYWVNYTNEINQVEGEISHITASSALTAFYGGGYTQVNAGTEEYNLTNADGAVGSSLTYTTAAGIQGKYTALSFGFNPIRLPFVPVSGDHIRFEFSPDKDFKILQANNTQGTLIMKLSGQIEEGTVLDNFVIYRIINNGQYIILDVKKNVEAGVNQAFTGIVTSEFPSENLQKRGDSLLFDLKQANILEG